MRITRIAILVWLPVHIFIMTHQTRHAHSAVLRELGQIIEDEEQHRRLESDLRLGGARCIATSRTDYRIVWASIPRTDYGIEHCDHADYPAVIRDSGSLSFGMLPKADRTEQKPYDKINAEYWMDTR